MIKKETLKAKYQKAVNYAVVVGTPVLMTSAHAAGEVDTSTAVSTLGYALAALGAIGAAKLAPAAMTWVWSLVTQNAKRG